jgi:hypothetical protein
MLDDVERRGFLVKPAGESPCPALVGALKIDLDECAGQRFFLPRRSFLAGAQANDDVAPFGGLARLEGDLADDPITLVEQAEHGHPLGHRCHTHLPPRQNLGFCRFLRGI